ncbi:MAG: helix-turn-helix transcriptional regulator [Victivallaceae bacterium]|nr:helix-turn-helix transcriptional regulator [Victivallaceae bacterium]
MDYKKFFKALDKAIEFAGGSQLKLAKKTGVDHGTINKVKNGKKPVLNLTFGTLLKLFPDMQIDYFGTGEQRGCIAKIVKVLNNLTNQEQESIYEAIIACYPQAIDSNIKNSINKSKIEPIDEE